MNVVYRLFDAYGELLYLGATNNLRRRLSQHRERKAWFGEVEVVEAHRYGSQEDARQIERLKIPREHPRYNIALRVFDSSAMLRRALDYAVEEGWCWSKCESWTCGDRFTSPDRCEPWGLKRFSAWYSCRFCGRIWVDANQSVDVLEWWPELWLPASMGLDRYVRDGRNRFRRTHSFDNPHYAEDAAYAARVKASCS